MNFINRIRSCFWQDDLGAPTQGENQRGIAVDGKNSKQQAYHKLILESVLIKKTEGNDSEELEQKVSKLKEEVIEMMIPVMMMNKTFWNFLDDIEKAAKELHVAYSLVDNVAFCEGKAKDVERFETLMEKFHRKTIRGEKKRNIYLGDDFNRKRMNWEDKNFLVPLDLTREDVDVVLYKAKKKDLKFRFEKNVLNVCGDKFDLSLFSGWLEEFTKNRKKQKQEFKEFLKNLKLMTITEKIQNLSNDDDLLKQDMMKKASVLGIECIFDEDSRSLEISGRVDKVRCFKSYLQAINPMFPKYLYPKYWDFDIKSDYAEIEVEPTSEEFREIKSKVCGSLRSASLTKVKRIQNQGVMNNYLTMICSEKKKKKERRLLFYGPEIQEPEKIYKYSKAGFDLSYASFKGRFGRGLYFPITALYVHGSAYEPSPKTFQVLVADVFVGEALNSSETNQSFQNNSLRAYDSLFDRDNFYVVYKNSQSYPLYLVEYTLQLGGGVAFVEDQKVLNYEDDYEKEEEEKIADVRIIENFECPLELSPQAWDDLKMQIEILNLTLVEIKDSIIRVSGNETNLETFSQWLNEFFSGIIMGEDKIEEIFEKKNEKIAYSMLYNAQLAKIVMKATELEVDCLLSKNLDQMRLTGLPKNLESFKAYLHKISHEAKKYLFPKYWDFSIIQPYAEIEVNYESEEWKEISKFFKFGFDNAQVSRLTRIQNYDLFNSYISTICSRTQVNPDTNLQRKLLFHGTRHNDPSDIYECSEVGFDMKFANAGGKYGKGIYFSTNLTYSHSYAHYSGVDTYKMLMADVFTGFSFTKKRNTMFSQLTDDQDSLYAQEDNFFVLFKNSQSYPLYLVEYTLSDRFAEPQVNFSQKHMTNILSGGQYYLLEQPDPELLFKPSFKIPEPLQKPDIFCIRRLEKEFSQASNDEFLADNFFLEKVEKAGCIEWLVSFIGFQDTPYEGGLFKLKVIFPGTYPLKPPSIQFLTKIYHPCINDQGMVCMGLLSNWAPTSEVRHVLLVISCLLHDPSMEDPLVSDRMALFLIDRNEYMKIARTWTNKYACI